MMGTDNPAPTIPAHMGACAQVITHELPLTEAPHAYKIFNEKQDGCVKVVMHPWD